MLEIPVTSLQVCLVAGTKNGGSKAHAMRTGVRCLLTMQPYIDSLLREDIAHLDLLRGKTVHRAFAELALQDRVADRHKPLDPIALKTRMGRIDTTFATFDQQDSHEFFARLINTIESEVGTFNRKCWIGKL